ncbi:hypothetical protein [Sphaerotilus sp.]|uniref:hypothetical protein n=1 Tax=Sphaerotilus sp. TaxID=2093942 RepID=UPI002ACE4B1A|nr:hypothetical protein [Sphaerotilus sp.]MDZ7855285.1 hypothetical protein [Sphaerotilus sp.]
MRLPADVRFPAETRVVTVRVVGQERIIAPLNSAWDSFFLAGLQVTDDFMSERVEGLLKPSGCAPGNTATPRSTHGCPPAPCASGAS